MLGHRSQIEHKIIPALGELRLSRVDTATLDRFLAQLSEREHPTDCVRGLPLSPSAVRDVHAVLAGAFKQAQRTHHPP
jgi:hypothetical protein